MPTQKQIDASRANGARSRGPITAQGKRNSSRNSRRHGLLSSTLVLEEESTERFEKLVNSLMDEHQPRTFTELMLVETMAAARWRLYRIWGIQKSSLDRDMALQDPAVGPPAVRAALAFRSSPDTSSSLELLLRYEIAFDRQFTRALSRLKTLQSQRASGEPLPYHPELPSGQTWKDSEAIDSPSPAAAQPEELPSGSSASPAAAAERTRQVVELPQPQPELGLARYRLPANAIALKQRRKLV